ncbi:MAG: T9SS type A sorting domain-containing protein [Saprospiraceae bacterium]|nr:T9SS type A sorting domain-containing protein [Saprospiraceae bacterium]
MVFFIIFQVSAQSPAPTKRIVGDSTGTSGERSEYIFKDRILSRDTVWLLDKFVYVEGGAKLTIQSGTIIKGGNSNKDSVNNKSAVIVTRGSQIIADGKRDAPIVFTSVKPVGERRAGNWGGIIILGRAANNAAFAGVKGEQAIEGGVNDTRGRGIHGGGASPVNNDNSGILRYVRIEYAGSVFSPNNEINSLTMGSVGSGTVIENIQTSFGGDDSYEWFGGTVNAKNLVSFKTIDDDFDTDNGFSGNIQFGYILRDPNIADSGTNDSNGFESDNDGSGTFNAPFTTPTFSNITFAGPRGVAKGGTILTNHNVAARIRRNSRHLIANSILLGARSTAIFFETAAGATAAKADTNKFLLNTIIPTGSNGIITAANSSIARTDAAAAGIFTNNAGFLTYLMTGKGNDTTLTETTLNLTTPFDTISPDPRPKTGSTALTGAAFTDTRLNIPFFEKVTFRGAFGATNWMAGWTNFRPDTSRYLAGVRSLSVDDLTAKGFAAKMYPNPASNNAIIELSLEKEMTLNVQIFDVLGREIRTFRGQRFNAGENTFALDLSNVSNGLYFVRFFSNDLNAQKTLQISISK